MSQRHRMSRRNGVGKFLPERAFGPRKLPSMVSIRIDDELHKSASNQRKADWSVLLGELELAEELWPARSCSSVVFGRDDAGVRVRFVSDAGVDVITLAKSEIEAELNEYLAVILRLEEEDIPMARLEALDMAKRVVHDQAAKRLAELWPDLSPSLETRRRAWSLVVAVLIDTTGRRMGHGYR